MRKTTTASILATALWSSTLWAQPPPYDEEEPATGVPPSSEVPTPPEPPASGAQGDPAAVPDASGELCITSFMAAQRSRYAGSLLDARQHLIQCASPTCPSALRNQCGPWLNELRPLIPSIVVVAKDLLGRDTNDVRVSVDGELVADKLDGLPIDLDPGVHELQLEHDGRIPITRRVVLAQGKQNYEVLVDFSLMEPGPEEVPSYSPRPASPVPPLAWVGLSVGGAGILVGVTSGIVALERSATLHEECASEAGCSRREIDEAVGFAHASTVGFGIGGVGVVTTVIALLVAWPGAEESKTARLVPWAGPETLGVELRF